MAIKLIKEAFNPRALEKYGFKREPELDFSDDGNRFKGYLYKDKLPMSYLRTDGKIYISLRLDYLKDLNYNEYSKLPSYKDSDKYNGISEDYVDLQDLANIADRLIEEYNEVSSSVGDVSSESWEDYCDKYIEYYHNMVSDLKNKIFRKFDDILSNRKYYDNRLHFGNMDSILKYYSGILSLEKNWIDNKSKDVKEYASQIRNLLSEKGMENMTKETGDYNNNFYYKQITELLG